MTTFLISISISLFFLLLHVAPGNSKQFEDKDYLAFAMNLEYLETDFFLCAAFGYDLSEVDSNLTEGGPVPTGCQQAHFYAQWILNIVQQFAYEEIGHLKAIKKKIQGLGFPRPKMDLSVKQFATIVETALSKKLIPPFDPYANDLNFLIAAYIVPYVGLTAYVGAAENLQDPQYKKLVAGLLGVESGQDAVLRALLFEYKDAIIDVSGTTVAEVTGAISNLRNKLGNNGVKDEGIWVDEAQGAEGQIAGNVLAGDEYSVAYSRSPREVLNILYSKINGKNGGFFPLGCKGKIVDSLLIK